MVEKILNQPEVWQIYVQLPESPLKNLNSYVIRSREKSLIIDTGFNRAECREALLEGIRELGLDLTKTEVFLTHLHADHIGNSDVFTEAGCKIYMSETDYACYRLYRHEETRKTVEDIFSREGFPDDEIAQQATKNHGRIFNPKLFINATTVKDGEMIKVGDVEIQCVSTPGHTPGHMMLYLPKEEVLFTGDHILFDISPNISIWLDVPLSLKDYMESLKKAKELSVKMALPAHRTAHLNYYERIDQLLHHHELRLDEIYDAVKEYGPATAYEIAQHIKWSMRGKPWSEFPVNQKWFAIGETLTHLYLLMDRGLVVKTEGETVNFYSIK